jgi:heme O synthase-like polyprenyltransferase
LLVEEDEYKLIAKKIFVYSILYLFLIFVIILIDNIL